MKLLIVTPTLGRSPHLHETVACINGLEIPIYHILACPKSQISELKRRFPRSSVVCDQGEEAGLYGAINAGLAAAQESWDFFTYLNDDDLFGNDFAAMFKRHGVPSHLNTVGFGCISNIDGSGRRVMGMTVGPDVRQYPALLQSGVSPTGQQGMVFGRNVVEAIGMYSTRYKVCGDLDYWCRAMSAGFRFIFYPLEAGQFRVHEGQISGDVSTLRSELKCVTSANFPRQTAFLRKQWAKVVFRIYNLRRYSERILRYGFKSSYQLLESKTQDVI
jgi:GT2 family glycosyltransferase